MHKFSIGQQVRIVHYSHPHCGEFGTVKSVLADGNAAVLALKRFSGKLVAVMLDQTIPAPGMKFDDGERLPECSRSSHYS